MFDNSRGGCEVLSSARCCMRPTRIREKLLTEQTVAYAGRLAPRKGLSALLRADIQVLKREPHVKYIIAGDFARNAYTDALLSFGCVTIQFFEKR